MLVDREQGEPGRARHSGHGDHDHDDHDTDASIQTILKDLVKQSNHLAFTCEAEGTFPHPLDCSKYYLCDKDKEVRKLYLSRETKMLKINQRFVFNLMKVEHLMCFDNNLRIT